MLFFTSLLFLQVPIPTVDSPQFSTALQNKAVFATVRIINPTLRGEGSGVMVGKNGAVVYVLTASHVVKDTDHVEVAVFSEKSYPQPERTYSARVVAKVSDIRDLALLRMAADDPSLAMLPILPPAEQPKGNAFPALSVGCVRGEPPVPVLSNVTGKKKVAYKSGGETAYFWETPGSVAKGRSGGPLVDERGFVIGICSGTNDGKGYYCHPDEIHRFLQQNVFGWLTKNNAR